MSKFERFGAFVDRCESPVERMFLAALLFLGDYTFEPFEHPPVIARDATGLELGQQQLVDGHRLDFTLTHPGATKRFAIEIDGFVHHGSTPAQFERDSSRQRTVTARGWTFLRFSGREVRRDPRRCADEAMQAGARLVPNEPGQPVSELEAARARVREAKARGDVQAFDAAVRDLGVASMRARSV